MRVRSLLLALAVCALLMPGGSLASQPFNPAAAVAALPAPYSQWNVQLVPTNSDQRLRLSFDSDLTHGARGKRTDERAGRLHADPHRPRRVA